jgi:hypothetical protein
MTTTTNASVESKWELANQAYARDLSSWKHEQAKTTGSKTRNHLRRVTVTTVDPPKCDPSGFQSDGDASDRNPEYGQESLASFHL